MQTDDNTHIKKQADILKKISENKSLRIGPKKKKIRTQRTFTSDLQISVLTETLTVWYSSVTCNKIESDLLLQQSTKT